MGRGEAWCLAISSSQVSLAAVSPQRARGIWWSISKCFMEGVACCPSCPAPAQQHCWPTRSCCMSVCPFPVVCTPQHPRYRCSPRHLLEPLHPSHRCVLAEALDGSLVLCRDLALLLHPATIWG